MLVQSALYAAVVVCGVVALQCRMINERQAVGLLLRPLMMWLLAIALYSFPVTRSIGSTVGYAAFVSALVLLVIYLISARSRVADGVLALFPRRIPPLMPSKELVALTPPSIHDLYNDRTIINLTDEINASAARAFQAACTKAAQRGGSVLVQISTQGGVVDWGRAMYEQLRILASRPGIVVDVLVVGVCRSAGVSIMMAVPRENRWATPRSRFMVHGAVVLGVNNEQIPIPQLSATVRQEMRQDDEELLAALREGTALSPDAVQQHIRGGRDYVFSAEQAVRLGVVGGVVDIPPPVVKEEVIRIGH